MRRRVLRDGLEARAIFSDASGDFGGVFGGLLDATRRLPCASVPGVFGGGCQSAVGKGNWGVGGD